jgi:hypothetical protein
MYKECLIIFGESLRKTVDCFRRDGLSQSNGDESFRQGYLMGLHRTFTLLQQAADVYKIPIQTISLEGLDEQGFLK